MVNELKEVGDFLLLKTSRSSFGRLGRAGRIFICHLLLFHTVSFSQRNDNTWLLCSEDLVFNFDSGSLFYTGFSWSMDTGIDAGAAGLCRSTISDSSGSFLMLCNGYTILNKERRFIQGGKFLIDTSTIGTSSFRSGASMTGAAMILPRPGNSSQYVVLHFDKFVSNPIGFHKLYFTLVDMTADSGRGAVISLKNEVAQGDFAQGHFATTKHANGIDWWIVKKDVTQNKYYTFLLTSDTITLSVVQQLGTYCDMDYDAMMCFSPDGCKLAMTCASGYTNLFNFNRCNGELTLKEYISTYGSYFPSETHGGGYATTFSPNSRVLYISQTYRTLQFDTWADTVSNTMQIILDTYPDHNSLTFGQIGLDGKIYFGNRQDGSYYGFISNPDSFGIACNPCVHCINIAPALNPLAIPYFPNFRLKAAIGYDTIGTSQTINLCAGTTQYISTQPYKKHYTYTVSTDGINYSLVDTNAISVSPNQTTTYYFLTTDTSIDSTCHRNYKTDTVTVIVLPSATNLYTADAGTDTTICPNQTLMLGKPSNPPTFNYQWLLDNQPYSNEPNPLVVSPPSGDLGSFFVTISDPLIDTTCALKTDTITVTVEECPLIIPTLVRGTLTITNLTEPNTLTLYNLLGQKVFETSNYQNNFKTQQLASGVYLYRFTDQNQSTWKGKIVVIN